MHSLQIKLLWSNITSCDNKEENYQLDIIYFTNAIEVVVFLTQLKFLDLPSYQKKAN